MEKIQKVIVSTLRSSGQALDKIGRTLETNSYVEKCKFTIINDRIIANY